MHFLIFKYIGVMKEWQKIFFNIFHFFISLICKLPKQGYVGAVGGRGGSEGGDYPAPRVHQGVGEEREHHREQRDRAKGRVRYL